MNKNWDQYSEYEELDKLLSAQKPRSLEAGNMIHDEMLFIVFHQVYELWFKQILFELDDIQRRFSNDIVDDRDMLPILTYLNRIVEIFKNLVGMIDILETMPPQSFIDFREYLGTASGFQSWQFRLIEVRLGLRREDRLSIFHGEYDDDLKDESKQKIKSAEQSHSLFDQIDGWLSRTPFVDIEEYEFIDTYKQAVYSLFDEKIEHAQSTLQNEALENELSAIQKSKRKFDSIFDQNIHKNAAEDGLWRLSWKALQAALFITIYREEPILQAPHKLLSLIMDIDELLARWRYRHALMVQRMVGFSMGSGGSSGYGYLMETLEKHRVFSDLFSLSTFLIPGHSRPPLPESLSKEMGYRYSASQAA
jgi:tryptophan 2,3-dioxygenase